MVASVPRKAIVSGMALMVGPVLLVGCGGKKGLSASEYRARLAAIAKEVTPAQANVEKALHATSMVEFRKRLLIFAAASDRLGDEVAKLHPPKNAQKANHALAKGEHDTADEVRTAVAHLSKETSVK